MLKYKVTAKCFYELTTNIYGMEILEWEVAIDEDQCDWMEAFNKNEWTDMPLNNANIIEVAASYTAPDNSFRNQTVQCDHVEIQSIKFIEKE